HSLDERCALTDAGATDGLLDCKKHSDGIVSVYINTGKPVALGPVRNARDCCAPFVCGVFSVTVILADENHRQLPHSGEVQTLVECTDVRRSVPKISYRHFAVLVELRRPCEAIGDRNA